ncbi:MAG: hypothetical protein B7733_13580 [Myxococcales bacterium FL481]|nr:MAG: hypothetical protein B7733_13580 [Myxococcales bacterium FL481]
MRHLYPSLAGGKLWEASWDDGVPRTFDGVDPRDPWFDADHGSATYSVDGDGNLRISGSTPRMYVHDPDREEQWRDVEITMYFRRVADSGTNWGGLVAFARSNHGTIRENGESGDAPSDESFCDSRGVGARFRYDGRVDFEKETDHPASATVIHKPLDEACDLAPQCDPAEIASDWSLGMPYDAWFGAKYVVYDRPDGQVHLELWLDESEGVDGGHWVQVAVYDDDGREFGVGSTPCGPGIDPAMPLTNAATRVGSESGRPNITVYFRSDGVSSDGLWYRYGSVREIQVP